MKKPIVSIIKTQPESVLKDTVRLFDLADGPKILDSKTTTILKDNISWHYPLPSGFEYLQEESQPPVVVRSGDGARFSFLIEEGLLTFNEPYTREDGRTGYKTTEVFKRGLR